MGSEPPPDPHEPAPAPRRDSAWSAGIKPLIRSSANIVGALVIAYAFVVILMTAITQQTIVGQLGEGEPRLSYSSAHALVRDVEERRASVSGLRERERPLETQQADLKARLDGLQSDYDGAWRAFMPFVRRITAPCGIEPTEEPESEEWRLTLWSDAQQCRQEGRLPEAIRARLQPLQESERNFGTLAQQLGTANAAHQRALEQLQAMRVRIEAERRISPEEQRAWQAFNESNVLRDQLLLGGGALVAFPPSLLQLLLALSSGMFGALLITLVLIVYPQSTLRFSTAGNYGARIMLGGLIAVCVYIMLLGGTAVLGATAALSGAGANYMAFCAVAVLAGMFSDRVAAWLSSRANTFFQGKETSASDEPRSEREPAPAPPPAPVPPPVPDHET